MASFTLQLARRLRPDLPTVLGGQLPWLASGRFLCASWASILDVLVVGEGDEVVVPILRSLEALGHGCLSSCALRLRFVTDLERRLPCAASVVALPETPVVIEPPLTQDLDALPTLAYDSVLPRPESLVTRIWTSRGCASRCSFCSPARAMGHTIRTRSVDKVMCDIEAALEASGRGSLVIGDMTFFHEPDHSETICRELVNQYHGSLEFWCQTRLDRITEPRVELLRSAGCRALAIGIETLTQQALSTANKEQSAHCTREKLRMVRHAGIDTQAYIVVGLPGESVDSLLTTFTMIHELLREDFLTTINPSILVPFPGLAIPEGVKTVDRELDNYAMCVFPDQNPYPVYEMSGLGRYEIRLLWEFLLSGAMRAVEWRSRHCTPR